MANRMKTWLPWALVFGAGVWAARRPEVVRGALHDAADRLSDAIGTASDTLEPLAHRVGHDVLPSVAHGVASAASRSSHVAGPLLAAAGEVASDWLGRGTRAVHDVSEWGEETAHGMSERAARGAKGLGAKVGTGLAALGAWRHHEEGKAKNMQTKLEKQLMARMARYEDTIHDLTRNLDRVTNRVKYVERPRRGGISLGTILLGAGAYYLYKNPDVLNKALEDIGAISPSAERHLERAGEAVKDSVERIKQGDDPVDAAKDAAKIAGSEAGKAGKAVKSEAERAAKDVAADAKDAARDVGNAAKDAARDAQKMSA
jgi:hypothetical protein